MIAPSRIVTRVITMMLTLNLLVVANAADKLVYFMSIDKARFRHPVVPGDLLRIPVKLQRARAPVWRFTGEAYVDGKLCAEAEYSAMIMDKAGRPANTNE